MNPIPASVNLYVLFAGLALATAPHTPRLALWVDAFIGFALAWRIYLAVRGRAMPSKKLVAVLGVAGFVGVFLSFRTVFGRDAGVTLLVLLMSLKLLEMRLMRDVFVLVFLAYFLALTNFFYSQTIPTSIVMLATVMVITASLVGFNAPGQPAASSARTAGLLLLQASPVMVLLFFLFPRVSGPLWGLPQDAFAGVTGLSDTMSPGAISRLSSSDAIAFRVRYEGAPPPRSALYWRGPVLWGFDGRTWRPGMPRLDNAFRFEAEGNPIDYEITLEPHNRQWLFALDLPSRLPPNARITTDFQMLSIPPVRNRLRYELRSYPRYKATSGADSSDLRNALELPGPQNPRARELGEEWKQKIADADAIVREAINFFRGGNYLYTLSPPLLGDNTVDEFLFDTKQGFCEHFASAFTVLMRAAGVPARVVTGYQGGEINPVDNYMVVRQAEAHAWSEVWLGPERGWVRVDPTAAAFPVRVEGGLAASVPQSSELPLLMRTQLDWLRQARFNWDALTNRWNQWVLGYNTDRQRDMLSRFGMQTPNWQTLAMLLFWSVAAVIGLTALWLLRRARNNDPVQRAWLAFCNKLANSGLIRRPDEGPQAFAMRALRERPQLESAVKAIVGLYVELRYGRREGDQEATRRLGRLVREFRP